MFAFEYELPREAGDKSLEYRKAFIEVEYEYDHRGEGWSVYVNEIWTVEEDGETPVRLDLTDDENRWAVEAYEASHD